VQVIADIISAVLDALRLLETGFLEPVCGQDGVFS
jgi:hypothetical protein